VIVLAYIMRMYENKGCTCLVDLELFRFIVIQIFGCFTQVT